MKGSSLIHRLGERLDVANVDAVRRTLAPVIDGCGKKRLALDMENLQRCDSFGLELLLWFVHTAGSAGITPLFYRPSENLRMLIAGSGMFESVRVVDSL